MNVPETSYPSYSADVRMQLRVNGHVYLIGHLGPDFVILDNPADHPPSDAEITLSIDGRPRSWKIHLPEGVAAGKVETRIADPA